MKFYSKSFALFAGICLAMFAGKVFAGITAGSGYEVETVYTNTHEGEIMASFDWDSESNLYYSTGQADWSPGFSVYRHDNTETVNIYTDTEVYSGSRLTAIAGFIYFNDGGTYENISSYFRYDPANPDEPVNMEIESDLWGLETRDGTDVWAAGGMSASIYRTTINENGEWTSNPLVNLGEISGYSGPLAFDANGNLYYSQGYNTEGAIIYRWSTAEVAAAIANPQTSPLQAAGHVWTTLSAGDGASGMAVDGEGYPLVTATSFTDPSELQRLLIYDGICLGYEVLARASERMETLRIRDGQIYFNTPNGIFNITPAKTLRIVAQAESSGGVIMLGLNDADRAMRIDTVIEGAPQWILRGMDGNRLLVQAGDGGAVGIAELDNERNVTDFTILVDSVPGWIARGIAGNRILAQAGDGGTVGIQRLGPGYTLEGFTVVMDSAPGWIARDIDTNRILAQAGDGGAIALVQLDDHDAPAAIKTVMETASGMNVRSLAQNLLLMQTGNGGMSELIELDEEGTPFGKRLGLNPLPGWSLLGLTVAEQ